MLNHTDKKGNLYKKGNITKQNIVFIWHFPISIPKYSAHQKSLSLALRHSDYSKHSNLINQFCM